MSEDLTDAIAFIAFILLFAGCIGVIGLAVYLDGARHDKCLSAGGIPIERYCVKPDSFIGVK